MTFKEFYHLKESVSYQPPSSPKYLMADFYMLAYISTIDFDQLLKPSISNPAGITSAIRGERYKDDIEHAKTVLYPRLQRIILDDTFFSIVCEGTYALQIVATGRSPFYAATNDSIDDRLEDRQTLKNTVGAKFRRLALEFEKIGNTDQEGFSEYKARYQVVTDLMQSVGMDQYEFVKTCEGIFGLKTFWSDSYGGGAWVQVCRGWRELNNTAPTDYNKLATYIDHMYDIEHNNGSIFNKIERYADKTAEGRTGEFGWIKEFLNYKAATKNMHNVLIRCSTSMQKLALPVLKAAGIERPKPIDPLDDPIGWNNESTTESGPIVHSMKQLPSYAPYGFLVYPNGQFGIAMDWGDHSRLVTRDNPDIDADDAVYNIVKQGGIRIALGQDTDVQGKRVYVGEVNKPNVTYAAKKTAKELVEHYEREINFNQMTFWQTAVSQNKYVDRDVD